MNETTLPTSARCRSGRAVLRLVWLLVAAQPVLATDSGCAPMFRDAIDAGTIRTVNGLAITSDWRAAYVTVPREAEGGRVTIGAYRCQGEGWRGPEIVLADAGFGESDYQPVLSPDEDRLYFTSNRPFPGETGKRRQNPWFAVRDESGDWHAADAVHGLSSPHWDGHAVPTSDRWLYFASDRPGGAGLVDIYRARLDGRDATDPQPVTALNSADSDNDFSISRDGRWMILSRYSEATRDIDLYVSQQGPQGWSQPIALDAINTAKWELSPCLTPDGRQLVFHSAARGGLRMVPLADLLPAG